MKKTTIKEQEAVFPDELYFSSELAQRITVFIQEELRTLPEKFRIAVNKNEGSNRQLADIAFTVKTQFIIQIIAEVLRAVNCSFRYKVVLEYAKKLAAGFDLIPEKDIVWIIYNDLVVKQKK